MQRRCCVEPYLVLKSLKKHFSESYMEKLKWEAGTEAEPGVKAACGVFIKMLGEFIPSIEHT